MCVVSLHLISVPNEVQLVRAVRPITGQSLAEIRSRVGASTPLLEWELFLNDFVEKAATLERLLDALEEVGARFTTRESGHVITPTTLRHILSQAEGYD